MKRALGILVVLIVIGILAFWYLPSFKITRAKPYEVTPELFLKEIKVLQAQESAGDELYLTISIRRPGLPAEYIRVPERPDHWLSRQLDLVKDIQLWSEPIANGETVTLMIELNEQDAEPLNPDDLLGIMRVKIKNTKGSLDVHWDIPNWDGVHSSKKSHGSVTDTVAPESGSVEKFDLKNDGAHYEMYLMLKK